METREKITLFLILIFFFFCIIFSQNQKANARRSLNSFSENDPLTQFNQTSSINITGVASTLDQATIDSYLNVNADSLTWDVTEANVTPPPAWPLTFTTQQVESLSVTPLNSDKFVVAWCDEASKTINFKIYSTTGQVLVDTVTVDSSPGITNACDYNSVSVAALNSTHFAIAWFDAAEQDATFAVYDSTGTLRLEPIDEDTDVGTNSWGVSISAFNSTHIVIGYYDYTDQDATFSTWNLVTQTRVAGPVDVDAGVSTDCYNVHVAALDSNNFVFFYYDAGATDNATFAIYTITGTAVKAATDEDAAVGNSYSLSLTVLNSSYFILAYYDAADADITFSIYNSAGTRVVGPIDEDTDVGTSGAWVSVAALNSTHFVIAYYDATDGQHTFSIYNWGTRVVGPIDVSSTTLKWVSVASYLAAVNIGICNQNWIFAEAYTTSSSRFFAYNPSGTQWNGYCAPIYQVSVEHNTTISYSGILNSINVSINFTSTVDDIFNMTIYDFANSKWDASPCQNISAIANNYYTIWCNVTSNPTNYVSSDNKVMVRLNSTVDNDQSTLKEEYIQFYISYLIGYLEVELIQPNPEVITNIAQNSTFLVNATVFCREGPCGYINGTLMYNLTSPYPDTPINISFGDKPFFVNESPPQATKACPNNPLNQGDFCNLTWIVNTTGDVGTNWKIGVLFNSSLPEVGQNHTSNATVSIVAIMEGLSISWNSIDFGFLIPNTQAENNPAPGNSYDLYNITNTGSCSLQLWIKGTDLVNSTLNSSIAVGNLSWSNSSKVYNPSTVYPLDYSYKLLYNSLSPGSNLTTYYWLSVPSVYAGVYKGTITICGNCSSSCD